MNEVQNDEYWKAASSMVSTEQQRLVALGMDKGEARRQATSVVSEVLGITPQDLGSGMGRLGRSIQLQQATSKDNDGPADIRNGPSALYLGWIADNDYIPSDKAIAHFSGYSAAAPGYARNVIAKDRGYEFTKAEHNGWTVSKRPKTRPTIDAINKMAEQKAVDFMRQIKDELLKEFGYK